MGDGPRKVVALFGVLLFLFLFSCGTARREEISFSVQQAQLDFTNGDFQSAIDIYKGAYQKYPKDSGLLFHYVKTLEQIKSHGEKADARGDFALAGSAYEILLRNYSQFADFAHSLSFDKDFLETRIKTGRNLLIEKEAQPYLEIGNFQKVIDVYQAAYQQYPHDSMLSNNYLQNLEAIKRNGDQAFERDDFVLAGSIYEILQRNYPQFAGLEPSLSFDKESLERRIQASRVLLAEKQAQMYLAAGDFQKTIETYKEVYQQNSKDSMVRSSYIKSLETIKRNGDQAFGRDDFVLAGSIYEILRRNYPQFAGLEPSLSFNKESLERRIQASRVFLAEKQAQMYLAAGDFQKTIETYKEVYQQNPKDAMVRSNYIKSLEAIKRSGDQAFERKDFALAGRSYGILRRNYPHFSDLNRSLSWRRKFLNDRIRNCRKILFENALEQYRSGNLSNATAIWKSILEFDPENAEVKKAVDTATRQLKNLEKMK